MRYRWTVVAILVAGLSALTAPASPTHAGVAGTAHTDDGYGVCLGAADAPVQLEIFCEPQCPDCAKFEAASDDQLVHQLDSQRLAVTYRWLTFLDERHHNAVSARLANALMTAADPATAPVAYQNFVAQIYRQQDRTNDSPTPADIAAMARASGIPGPVADRIAAGEPAVDTTAMDADNHNRLEQADPQNPGTPTVYDLNTNKVVDTDDAGWLDQLMSSPSAKQRSQARRSRARRLAAIG